MQLDKTVHVKTLFGKKICFFTQNKCDTRCTTVCNTLYPIPISTMYVIIMSSINNSILYCILYLWAHTSKHSNKLHTSPQRRKLSTRSLRSQQKVLTRRKAWKSVANAWENKLDQTGEKVVTVVKSKEKYKVGESCYVM